jgi:hypothetical protein
MLRAANRSHGVKERRSKKTAVSNRRSLGSVCFSVREKVGLRVVRGAEKILIALWPTLLLSSRLQKKGD